MQDFRFCEKGLKVISCWINVWFGSLWLCYISFESARRAQSRFLLVACVDVIVIC